MAERYITFQKFPFVIMSVKRKTIKERLEGSYRLIRIKRIKLGFFALQIVLAIVLGLVTAMLLDARFDPLYFPLDVFLFLFFLLMLIVAAEAVYFKGLEVRYTRSKSRKFLIARNSIRRSTIILVLALLCVMFLMFPFSAQKIADIYPQGESQPQTLQIGEDGHFAFDTQDYLGLSRATEITIDITGSTTFTEVYFNSTGDPLWNDRQVTNSYNFNNLDLFSAINREIDCRIIYTGNDIISYTWSVENELSPFMAQFLPALGIAFIIVELISIGIMHPIRETYASASIYSKKYVAEKEASVYLIDEKLTKEEAKEEELLESTLDIDISAPPPPPPPPKVIKAKPVPEKKEIVRKMGEIDEGIIEEPDIPCPTCGEMNSPHVAICFLCGNSMVVREVPAVADLTDLIVKSVELSKAGKDEEAIVCYDDILSQDKANEEALLGKGTALHRQGKWGQAIQHINTVLKVNPNNIGALLLKAEILSKRDKLDKAISIYNHILKIDPQNPVAKTRLEETAEEAEIEDVEEVIEQFMCIPGIGLARATILYESGFTSLDRLKDASEQDFAQIKGISERMAKKIKKNLESIG